MLKRTVPNQPAYAVIGKTRTLIWEHGLDSHEHPYVIYDPRARPQFRSASGPRLTSNYDTRDLSSGSRARFGLIASWLKPGLDEVIATKFINTSRSSTWFTLLEAD